MDAAILIREEEAADYDAIDRINELAFGQRAEADLVNALREAGALTLSLVACLNGEAVGHIAFSPVSLDGAGSENTHGAMGLAPMAVLPDFQKQGIGIQLLTQGITACRERNCPFVVVLGEPAYYGRFGFNPAVQYGITWEHPAPPEAFMVHFLATGNPWQGGVVRYHPAFGALS